MPHLFTKCLLVASFVVALSARAESSSVRLTHGPQVSAVTPSTVRVFGRFSDSAEVRIEYGLDRELSNSTLSPVVMVEEASDFTAHIFLEGLTRRTRYFYTFVVDGRRIYPKRRGTFETAPEESEVVDFSFAVISDAQTGDIGAPAYRDVAASDPAFVIRMGDFDHRDPGLVEPIDIENWRGMHRDILRDSREGRAFTARIGTKFPVYTMWDDHDYGVNNGHKDEPWKAISTQAFREYHPTPDLANPDGGNWYKFRHGQAEVFVLDLRSQRDSAEDPDTPEKSMLDGDGIEGSQLDWFLDGLLYSTATWKFIISTVPFNATVEKRTPDAWSDYQFERQAILDFVDEYGIEGVVVISGDIHTGGAIDDGTHAGLPEVSVPHFNLLFVPAAGCTAWLCGEWTEGYHFGNGSGGGFATIQVRHSDDAGHEATLRTQTLDGRHVDHTLRR